jgi:hypothetical protein
MEKKVNVGGEFLFLTRPKSVRNENKRLRDEMADAAQEDELTAMTPAQRKLFELRMKMNAGRKANKQVRR